MYPIGAKQATVVEPIDPFEGFPCDSGQGFPKVLAGE